MVFSRTSSNLRALALAATVLTGVAAFSACGGGSQPAENTAPSADDRATSEVAEPAAPAAAPAAAAMVGFTADQVKLGATIDKGMVAKGKSVSEMKCQSCHSMGANRVVGPGWENVTERRKPEWIMNMVVHTEKMLDTDPEAQKMLETCLVRMPNQGLTEPEARNVLEYMRTLTKK